MKKILTFLLMAFFVVPTIVFAEIEQTKRENAAEDYYAAKSSYTTQIDENIKITVHYSTSYTYEANARSPYFSSGFRVEIEGADDRSAYNGVSDLKYQIDGGEKLSLKMVEDFRSKEKPQPANIRYDETSKILVFNLYNKMKKMKSGSTLVLFIPISKEKEAGVVIPPEIVEEWIQLRRLSAWSSTEVYQFRKGGYQWQKEQKAKAIE